METKINTKNMTVYNCKNQEQAEREACFATAEDWMYGDKYEVDNTTYQYYIDPAANNMNVMLEITVDTISVFQITQIMLQTGEITVFNAIEL